MHYIPSLDSPASIANSGLLVSDVHFTAEGVADIYARVSGLPPLLREDHLDLPSVDVVKSSGRVVQPVLLGVCSTAVSGDMLPSTAVPLISSQSRQVASVRDVRAALKAQGITAKAYEIQSDNSIAVQKWIDSKRGKQSAVVVHGCSSADEARRRLDGGDGDGAAAVNSSSSSSSSSGPSIEQIQAFQVTLWTTVIFISILIAAISAMVNMEVVPDSLLFAKFQSARTSKND